MTTNPTRQDAEHRLASLVAAWVKTCEEKAGVVSEYNKDIKGLEEAIEKLSAEIQGGTFQPTLPFERALDDLVASVPLGPSLTVSGAGKSVTISGEQGEEVRQKRRGSHAPAITLSDSDPDLQAAQQEAVGPTEAPPDAEAPAACATCGHPDGVHSFSRKRHCLRDDCDCKGYVYPDPVG
ncbi:MAG: hypothetical protein MUO25_10980, partial [Thermoanaerobaculaceae bacterium]|nr:hypothetical protein [Thermoanaerobaculaceae bacterium]